MSRLFVALVLAAAGAILFGQGIYIHAKAMLAQVLLERAFAETITSGRAVKPWPWADTWPEARITVKRLGASAIALAGSSGQALAFGPGHVERTADAGERGVAVYSAHRDTHFRFLRDVAIGDEIDVTRQDGKTFRYRADGSSIVRFDQSGIDPFTTGHELLHSTWWPFDATPIDRCATRCMRRWFRRRRRWSHPPRRDAHASPRRLAARDIARAGRGGRGYRRRNTPVLKC